MKFAHGIRGYDKQSVFRRSRKDDVSLCFCFDTFCLLPFGKAIKIAAFQNALESTMLAAREK